MGFIMQVFNTDLTYHAEVQRSNRVEQIIANIGLGTIVKEVYQCSFDKAQAGGRGVYICITDTGITIVKDELKQKIITMYVTTFRELVRCYNGVKKIPPYLRKRVDRNQSYYTENGKTIWK